jgi:ATP-dependent helicase HrpA
MTQPRIAYPPDLPVSQLREEILEAISNHQVVVIAGATGSGKTTQLPKMCLELGRKSIAHTQPRRIAARSVAERIAEEVGVELGALVGYQVRFTDKSAAETRVKVMTDGILLNALQRDRLLKQYDTIIIDEAHERSLNIDFLLGYLKQLLPKRPDLKVIVTSATIDPESFSRHFGDAPIIEVSGRTYPIEIRYRPLAGERETQKDSDLDSENEDAAQPSDYVEGIIESLKELQREPDGDVLVFLSGESEIRDAQDAIGGNITSGALDRGTELLPLYGRLSAAEQHRVFERSRVAGIRRRVILATNVAETSLTIPNIKYVIDAGTARISRYSAKARVQRLPIEPISQASANQRAGRAGRLSSGVVIRLYSEDSFLSRPEFTDPEILRTNLASVILQAASIGLGDISKFPFIQAPDSRGVKDGIALLQELGAIEESSAAEIRLTEVGRQLSRLPIEPRFARMLIESHRSSLVREVMVIVAGLTIQDPRERPLEKRERADQLHARFADPTSDFLTLLNLWNYVEEQQTKLSSSAFRRLCKAEHLNYLRIREWQDLVRQLKSVTKPLGFEFGAPKIDPDGIHRSLLAGLLSHIGLRQDLTKKTQPEFLGSNGKKFVVFPGSTLAKKPPAAVMSAELVETSRLFARMNAAIDPAWAEKIAPELCRRSYSEPHWDATQGAVIGYERVTLFGVPIIANRRIQFSRIDQGLCRELFIRHALVDGEWDAKPAFHRANRSLLAKLEAAANRARKPQLAPDEQDVFNFYNQRIPADVFSTRTFEGWWRKAQHETPKLLTMTREDFLDESQFAQTDAQNPVVWSHGGQQLKLRYRFDPGAVDDGVCVDIPLPILASVSSDEFDWLVPGLRAELITELIRGLPKNIRRNVVPAGDWAKRILANLPETPTGNLLQVLAKTIQQLAGVVVKPEDFDNLKLTTAMRMTYRVIDSSGKTLGLSCDLAALKTKFASATDNAVAQVTQASSSPIERESIEAWDWENLDSKLESTHAGNLVSAFPTLVAEGGGRVALRVLATAKQQQQLHPFGVAALVRKSLVVPLDYLKDHLTANEKLALAALPYARFEDIVEDAVMAQIDQALASSPRGGMLFAKAEFEAVRNRVNQDLVKASFDALALLAKISQLATKAQKTLAKINAFDLLGTLSAEKQHLAELLHKGFVRESGLTQLGRYPTYLEAVSYRFERILDNRDRDAQSLAEFDRAMGLFVFAGGKLPCPQDAPSALRVTRWLLEEYRVSLFAQHLGAAEKVSIERIKKALGQ